jgi:AcrR family transcriptional regulator
MVATTTTPRLRADASRNRARIVAAAREAFVEHGAEAPIDDIARRAGVGNATVYRHFTDRRDLVRQVTLEVINRIVDHAEKALRGESDADAFEALRRFTHEAANERIGALCPMLSHVYDMMSDPELEERRVRLEAALDGTMERARRSGLLRPDVRAGDILVALTQLTRPLPGSECLDIDRFVHRHLQLYLDGLRAPAPSELPGDAATFADFQRRR